MTEQNNDNAIMKRVEAPPPVMAHELSTDAIVAQVKKVHEIMEKVMQDKVDYGLIPGCKEKSLFQAGAEKLCLAFRLSPTYTFTKTWEPDRKRTYGNGQVTTGFIRYEVICTIKHAPTGMEIAGGVGVCNNFERGRIMKDPYDVEETIFQMARKRALVNAVRTATAASALFTQDMEDLMEGDDTGERSSPAPEPAKQFRHPSEDNKKICPKCGGILVKRNGKKGEFYGCTNFKKRDCTYTADVKDVEGSPDSPPDQSDEDG